MASACTSKNKVTHLVNEYSNRWRYQLKAKKYAVQVHGENKKGNDRNPKDRVYRLGSERDVEKKT